jgi:hypothetical protein
VCNQGYCEWSGTCQLDAYEPDNNFMEASYLFPFEPQQHSICPAGEQDWWTFDLYEASSIILETSGVAGDTRLFLYDANLVEIGYDDDGGSGYFSRLVIPNLRRGLYYVLVDEYWGDLEIQAYNIQLQVTSTCIPDCTGRECGPDPVCGESCGTCPWGLECNDEGHCVEPPECYNDWDCPEQFSCISGRCVYTPNCFSDDDCPGQFYHCVGGECVYIDPCEGVWCPPDYHCEGGECVQDGCQDNSDCPPFQFCVMGICQGQMCNSTADCPPGQWCIMGFCVQACLGDSDCPEGYTCRNFFCQYDPCADVQCPPGMVCEDGACVLP